MYQQKSLGLAFMSPTKLLTYKLCCFLTSAFNSLLKVSNFDLKSKQKSPGRATSRSRSQPLTPEGREKVTQINACTANKQMHDKHKDSSLFPKQGDKNAKRTEETHKQRAGQDQT